jgi:hypothetical protein
MRYRLKTCVSLSLSKTISVWQSGFDRLNLTLNLDV